MARKKKDILVPLMEAIIRAGRTGLIVNASLARDFGCSQPGMCTTLKRLCEKKIVICSSGGRDKRVSVPQGITSHNDWLPLYFDGRGKVFPRYRKYLNPTDALNEETEKVSDVVASVSVRAHEDSSVEDELRSQNKKLEIKNEHLEKEVRELTLTLQGVLEENTRLGTIINIIRKALPNE